jgi:cholesterol transport system auxiliary component
MGKITLKSLGVTSKGAAAGLAALSLALVGCSAAPRETFDLSGASLVVGSRLAERGGTVVVHEPVALQPTASDRIVIRGAAGELSVLSDAQWADRLPRLVEARLITRLRTGGVDATFPGGLASFRLTSDLRRFEIDAARELAVVEIAVRLSSESNGARRGEAVFVGEAPAPHTLGPDAARALDAALNEAATRLVAWTRAKI